MLQPDLLECGDVIIVSLPTSTPRGREQQGTRPAVVVGIPWGQVRYPMLMIAPLTTQSGSWVFNNPSLYPRLSAGAGGLSVSSIVLLDQTRGLDINRVLAYLGTLTPEQYVPIVDGLRQGYFILKCDVFKVPLPSMGEGFRVRAKTTVLNLNRV